MRMPGYALDMPSEPEELIQRLSKLFPEYSVGGASRSENRIRQFVNDVEKRVQV